MSTPFSEFHQTGPSLRDPFAVDGLLKTYVRHYFPTDLRAAIEEDLARFGKRVVHEVESLGLQAEAQEPALIPYDPWGGRIDDIQVSSAWKALDSISAEEGLIAIPYARKEGKYSRPYQFAKTYLFHPSSAYYSCPLAMTDGAAKLIETHGDTWLQENPYKRLTTRDPRQFWTSGQWMTEKTGGSDVSGSETRAEKQGSGANAPWTVTGTKWFTSATTSQMAMLLAQTEVPGKGKGLSLFYVELRDEQDKLRNIQVLRLKDKLGTRALPTAELRLEQTPARLVGELGEGVKTMSTLFNVTRINNACAAVSTSARLLQLAWDYAEKRVAFKRPIVQHPLHLKTLSELTLDFYGCFALSFFTSELLGRSECDNDGEADRLLRLLTPVTKMYTAKANLKIASEVIEGFGGAGYIEDVGMAKYLRDSQVLSIWEGTTNVLSLDVLRALHKEGALPVFFQWCEKGLDALEHSALAKTAETLRDNLSTVQEFSNAWLQADPDVQQYHARDFSFSVARLTAGIRLCEFALKSLSPEIKTAAETWAKRYGCTVQKEQLAQPRPTLRFEI